MSAPKSEIRLQFREKPKRFYKVGGGGGGVGVVVVVVVVVVVCGVCIRAL